MLTVYYRIKSSTAGPILLCCLYINFIAHSITYYLSINIILTNQYYYIFINLTVFKYTYLFVNQKIIYCIIVFINIFRESILLFINYLALC